jgi:hypothetical protein
MIQPIDPDADKYLILAGEYTRWLDEKPAKSNSTNIPIAFIDFVLRNSVNLQHAKPKEPRFGAAAPAAIPTW